MFSIVEYERTQRGGGVLHCRIRAHTACVEVVVLAKSRIRAHIALEEELVVLAKSLHPRKRAYAARFKG